ncbi:MAG: hypothetical protein WKF84_25755 [Pyrinomonadaceae bacterium]
MQSKLRIETLALGLISMLIAVACEAPQTTTTTSTSNANISAAPSPAPASAPTPAAATANSFGNEDLSITFPVVDAFFTDEAFAADLKSKLQLTDEQIEKLRTTAREETAKLRESEGGERVGTTGAAHALYRERAATDLGPEKARQLSELIRSRWSEGVAPRFPAPS